MTYTANDIKTLSFKEGVRQRVQMYLGSADNEGAYQAFKEILNNSTDEALSGYGKVIDIVVNEIDNSISIRDYGRGVPFLVRENGENVLVNIYTKAHTGGKFDHSAYRNASGLNGIGGTCVCLSSLKFRVESYRDKKKAIATFYKGELQSYKEEKTAEKNGTYISFIPDPEVFSNGAIGYDIERICNDIKDISYLYPGIVFTVADENGEQSYCAKNGILDFIKDRVSKPLNKHILHWEETDGTDKVEIAFQWGTDHEEAYTFVNGLRVPEHGTTLTGAKTAITKTFNSLCDRNFNGDKIRENMCLVMNCQVVNPSFANQTKSKINNASLRTLCSKAFTNALKEMAEKYSSEFENIVSLMEKVDKAEQAANKAREAILNFEKDTTPQKKTGLYLSEKLKDCREHGEESFLGITEGDSALGAMAQARDIKHVALMPIRGKIISALKNNLDDVLANEEVKSIFSALNCGILDKYDSKKLRYGKVGIMTDADKDGLAIGCLIITLFYRLCPQFLQEGRLYWIRMPLYVMKYNKNTVYYAFDEHERDEIFNKYGNKCEVSRKKGIGENSVQDNKIAVFGEQKRWEQLIVEDWEDFEEKIVMMMGKDTSERKEFVLENVDFTHLSGE